MEYKEIIAITGLGGLFQLVSSKSDGAIVRSLTDNSTKFVSSRVHNFTPLESIEVYTSGMNNMLSDVFSAMKEKEADTPPVAPKSDNKTIKAYFQQVFPELDEDRVYVSDMKKMLKWYEILKANDLLNFESAAEEEKEDETAPAEEEATPEKKEDQPKAKATKKAAAKKKEE